MANAAFVHDALLPRAAGGTAPGAALALLVHAGLLLALTVSVDWKTSPPEVISAELWAAVPQVAAPALAEPPPAPLPTPLPAPIAPRTSAPPPPTAAPEPPKIDAQIAIERAEKLKAAEAALKREQERVEKIEREAKLETERQKQQATADQRARLETAAKLEKARLASLAEQKKQDEAAREAKAEKAEEARLALQREANLQRMLGQAANANANSSGATASTGIAAQDAAPSAGYSARLVALIRSNTVFTGSVAANAAAEVEVRAAAGGTIIARRLLKSSGNKEWDDAVLHALDRTAVLPRDTDGRVPPTLIISFRPRE